MWKVVNYWTDTVKGWYADEVRAEEICNELNRELPEPVYTVVYINPLYVADEILEEAGLK